MTLANNKEINIEKKTKDTSLPNQKLFAGATASAWARQQCTSSSLSPQTSIAAGVSKQSEQPPPVDVQALLERFREQQEQFLIELVASLTARDLGVIRNDGIDLLSQPL